MTTLRTHSFSNPPGRGEAFGGVTYDPDRDYTRLASALERVRAAVTGHRGEWWTLHQLAAIAQASEAGTSARLRDLRKPQFGGLPIEARRQIGGLWQYRLAPAPAPETLFEEAP